MLITRSINRVKKFIYYGIKISNIDSNKKGKTTEQSIVFSPPELREKLHSRLVGNKSDLTSRLLEKTRSSFDLSFASPTEGDIKVLAYPTDPFDSSPEIMQISKNDIQPGLSNERFIIRDPQ